MCLAATHVGCVVCTSDGDGQLHPNMVASTLANDRQIGYYKWYSVGALRTMPSPLITATDEPSKSSIPTLQVMSLPKG